MRIATILNAILMSLFLWGMGFVAVSQLYRAAQASVITPDVHVKAHAKAFIHLSF